MSINITIDNNSSFATVTLKENNVNTSKKVPLSTILTLFNSLSTVAKDTGYLSSNLLREVSNQTCSRAFFFKEFVSELKFNTREDRSYIKKSNPHGIKQDGSILIIPDFKHRNVLGFITNSNTDAFNPSFYKIYHAIPDIFNNVNDKTKLVAMFPNQFTSYICWPNDFDKKILAERDATTQATFISKYLTTNFNSDLFNTTFSKTKLAPLEKELDTFFSEVLTSCSSFKSFYSEHHVLSFYLIYYFISNIKGLNPANYTNDDSHTTLGRLFANSTSSN